MHGGGSGAWLFISKYEKYNTTLFHHHHRFVKILLSFLYHIKWTRITITVSLVFLKVYTVECMAWRI